MTKLATVSQFSARRPAATPRDPVHATVERAMQLLLSTIPAARTPIAGVQRVTSFLAAMLGTMICEGCLPVDVGAHALASLSMLGAFRANMDGMTMRAKDAARLAEILAYVEARDAGSELSEFVEYLSHLKRDPHEFDHQVLANVLVRLARRYNADRPRASWGRSASRRTPDRGRTRSVGTASRRTPRPRRDTSCSDPWRR